ncbi:hypothetical protein [Caulobacter sp. SSI4214]|uniref:hypothetical protein n=1 Tax=Caulobacter sp. SSI4214 TaxID=2575739 RepID=UPI001439F77E|nr:hypothetical protein [Caulobacter sp. SSI4214]
MKTNDGYTAAEALAALAILGLAMAGLTTSMGLIGMGQKKAHAQLEQAVAERAINQRLEGLLALDAPFRSDQANHLVGDSQSFELDCGGPSRCTARIEDGQLRIRDGQGLETTLKLPDGPAPRFVYIGSYNSGGAWPPAPLPPPAPSWQGLKAVAIQAGSDTVQLPLAVARVWRQQRVDCEYDVVIQDCRGAGS